MDIQQEKKTWRDSMEKRLKDMNDQARESESRSLCRRLEKELAKAAVIAAYYPYPTEPDIKPLLKDLLRKGHRIFLPCFTKESFEFRELTDWNTLQNKEKGPPEPLRESPTLKPEELDAAIIPARAYGPNGTRLGRGNGGYDRWIRAQRKAKPETLFIGVGFDRQIQEGFPMEEHDETVDVVVSPKEMIHVGESRK